MPALKSPVNSKILLTGATGYVGQWVLRSLLDKGYTVRVVVRSESKAKGVKELLTKEGDEGKVEFVVVGDLTKEGAFDEAVVGVDGIVHVATPIPGPDEDPYETIRIAQEATLSVAKSALKFGKTVKRIVFTSTCGTVFTDQAEPRTFSEADFNENSMREFEAGARDPPTVYLVSKILAEKGLQKFAEDHKHEIGWDVAILNPPFVYGPTLQRAATPSDLISTSALWMHSIISKAEPSYPSFGRDNAWVDVRDLGEAHVRCLEVEEAGGERIIPCAGSYVWQEWFDAVRSVAPTLLPKDKADKLVDGLPSSKVEGSTIDYRVKIDNSKEQRILGIKHRTKEEMVRDALEQGVREGALYLSIEYGTNLRFLAHKTSDPHGSGRTYPGLNIAITTLVYSNRETLPTGSERGRADCGLTVPPNSNAKVLVTGANGFVGQWVVRKLLDQGYTPRAVVRSEAKANELKKNFAKDAEKLEFAIVEDMGKDGAYDEGVVGVDAIIHVATPFPGAHEAPEDTLRIAQESAVGIFKSALNKGDKVKRIVVTSTIATIWGDKTKRKVYTENDDNDIAPRDWDAGKRDWGTVYENSKILAEKAIWKFLEEHKNELKFDATLINPPMVFGPSAKPGELQSTSQFWFKNIIEGTTNPAWPDAANSSWIDVRDLAEAHVKALATPEVLKGERLLVAEGSFVWQEWLDALGAVAHSVLPKDQADKLVAGLPKPLRKDAPREYKVILDTTKEKKLLGLTYHTKEDAVRDTLAGLDLSAGVSLNWGPFKP
ncbi:hypothetical protein NMY22_g7115 [Coprinellus aureogranulatus]|nr:hypothetical protein NMY22_g7115 [Coprinellus aureogranulatus]